LLKTKEVVTIATEEIYSQKIMCGKRTYFFNLKEQASGTRFIDIVESKYERAEDRHQRVRLVIFEDHIDEFVEALGEVAERLKNI
jgi:uncharacterized protein DUF3276